MRQSLIVTLLVGTLRREFARCDGERGLIRGIAFAKNDQSDIIREQPIQQRHKNLETFFLYHASDHSKNRTVRRRREIRLCEQSIATNLLSPKRARIVLHWEQRIGRRIPARVIRAVQNPNKAMRVFAKHAIETTTARRRLHFAPVALAHRCDPVGMENSPFEEIHSPEELDASQSEKSFVQIR